LRSHIGAAVAKLYKVSPDRVARDDDPRTFGRAETPRVDDKSPISHDRPSRRWPALFATAFARAPLIST
jgi:hypothetical protein